MESASELLGVGSPEHEIYKRGSRGKGGFWLAFDVTVHTAARNYKPRNRVAWKCGKGKGLPHPVPVLLFDCICPSRSGNADALCWKASKATKNKGWRTWAKIDKALPGVYYVKIQKCVGTFSEKALELGSCPINAPPSLASLTAPQLAQSLKSPMPCTRTPVPRLASDVPRPAALPSKNQ